MEARIENPALTVDGALQAMQDLGAAIRAVDIPASTLALVELRASQINGCSICADMHSRELKLLGESDERVNTVAAWREAPYFDDAERAALALAEAGTRIADRPHAVTDEIWAEAVRHFDEEQLAALVLAIATINAFNRVNAISRQITGDWVGQVVAHQQPAGHAS